MRKILFIFVLIIPIAAYTQFSIKYKNDKVGENIDTQTKEQIRVRATQLIEEYQDLAQFRKLSDLNNFELILSDDPALFNDLEVKPLRPDIELVDYLAKVETSLFSYGGFPFELIDLSITQLGVSANQLYFVKVNGTKVIKQKIDKNTYPKQGPFNEETTFYIEVNPYDMDDAYIYNIEGSFKARQESDVVYKVPKDRRFSVLLKGGFGSLNNKSLSDTLGLNSAKSKLTTYGIELDYRVNLDKAYKYYILGGLSAEFGTLTTDLSQLDLSNNPNLTGLPLSSISIPYNFVDFYGGISDNLFAGGILTPFEFEEGKEVINLTIIQAKLGLGYVVYDDNYSKKIFIDFHLIANQIMSRADGDISGKLKGLQLPNEDGLPFPDDIDWLKANGILQDVENLTLEDILVNEYKGEQSFNANENIFDIKPESNLSFGISLAPTYQQQITKNIGITLGLDYYLSLTSLMSNKNFNKEDQLFVGEDFNDRTASVLEDYFETNRLGKLSAKAGVLIRF